MEDLFGFCPNCTQTDFLFPSPQERRGMPPLNLCKKCLENYENNLPAKITPQTSETRYHEMAENLTKGGIKCANIAKDAQKKCRRENKNTSVFFSTKSSILATRCVRPITCQKINKEERQNMNKIIIPRCTVCNAVFLGGVWVCLFEKEWVRVITHNGQLALENICCPTCAEYRILLYWGI